jgi:hypothetical protein
MSDDLLEAATRALREESADDVADGRFTRARVMASLHQGKVKRRTRLAFILPLAACLAAGTAWGAATGRLPAMFQAVGQLVGYRHAPHEAREPQAKARASTGSPQAAAPARLAPVAATPEPAAEARPEPAKVEATPSATPTPSLSKTPMATCIAWRTKRTSRAMTTRAR